MVGALLVATTVVEVGVDVPEASIIIIECRGLALRSCTSYAAVLAVAINKAASFDLLRALETAAKRLSCETRMIL